MINKESICNSNPHEVQYEIQKLTNSFQQKMEQIKEQNQMIISKLQASEETEIEDMQKMIEYISKRDIDFDKKIEEIYQEAKKPWWKRW